MSERSSKGQTVLNPATLRVSEFPDTEQRALALNVATFNDFLCGLNSDIYELHRGLAEAVESQNAKNAERLLHGFSALMTVRSNQLQQTVRPLPITEQVKDLPED